MPIEEKGIIYSRYGSISMQFSFTSWGIGKREGRFNEYLSKRLFETEFNLSASEDGGWYWSIGTSMATPKVSAVAALLVDKYGKMSPAKLADLLTQTAVDPVQGTDQKWFGAGHLDAYDALK